MPGHSRAAVVRTGAHRPPIMCTVADISAGGVGLTFVSIAGVPDRFMLEIKGDPTIRPCKVAWRQEPHRLGVAFITDAEYLPEPPTPAVQPAPAPKGGDG